MMEIPNLRRLRQRKALSQEALAQKSGIALSTIMRLEKGKPARYVTVHKLAGVLGVPAEELARPVGDSQPASEEVPERAG